jgi:amino acid transporter
MTALERWLLAVIFIVALTALNVLGVRPTGRAAVLIAAATLAPVALFVAVAAGRLSQPPWVPFSTGDVGATTIGLGLAVAIWNYSGWDTPATALGEARTPEHNFRRASLLTLVVITVSYVVPVAVALANAAVPADAWKTGGWPRIAAAVGGPWLGHALAMGAVFSASGLFLALLLTNSRIPYVLSRARQLPAVFAVVHGRFGTPWVAILVSSAVYAAFAAFSFRDLVVVNVWLHSLALIVELAAFLRLRTSAPGMKRPWRIPGGAPAAWLAVVLPSSFSLLAMATAGWQNIVAGVIAALTAPLVYLTVRRGDSRR